MTLREKVLSAAVPLLLGFFLGGCSKDSAGPAPSRDATNTPAALAWQQLLAASQPTPMPESWRTNPPSHEEFKAFRAGHAERLMQASLLARDFHTRFPDEPNVSEALGREYSLVEMASTLGHSNATARLTEIEAVLLADATIDPEQRFQLKLQRLRREMTALQTKSGAEVAMAYFAKTLTELRTEFPGQPEVYSLLLQIAEASDSEVARRITTDVLGAATAPATARERAATLKKKLDREGQTLDLKFKALDGRDIDLAQLRGKVVLIDFWATWCGPCVAEMPKVKAAYAQLHGQGFEILGISLDNSRETLEAFLKKEEILWPQAFDGKGWENDLSRSFEISSVPTMWLVDKKGVVRDVFARQGLVAKVEKLLAE